MKLTCARFSFGAALMALWLGPVLAGCSSEESAAASGGGGSGTGSGTGSATGSGTGVGGGGGTGGTGGAPAACDPPPADVASAQTVTVTITNDAAADRYVLTAGEACDTILVEQNGANGFTVVPRTIPPADACGCECPGFPTAAPAGFHRIKPGETFDATWDARSLTTCTYEMDCGFGMTASQTLGAFGPVGPGEYRITYGATDALPANCVENGGVDDFTCTMDFNPPFNGTGPCGTQSTPPAGLTLPTSGDVNAALSLL
jgi:hypothetical protein